MILRRTSPDPGLGSPVELSGRHTGGLGDLFGIGKALPSERVAAEQAPPAFLQIELARSGGDEHVMDAGVIEQPGTRLQAVVTTEIVGDDEQVAFGGIVNLRH